MLEDRLLILKLKQGSDKAFCRLYDKYKDALFTLATSLLNDRASAEDVVHNVFVAFMESIERFEYRGSLRGYLGVCVVNRARNRIKAKKPCLVDMEESVFPASQDSGPEYRLIRTEQASRVNEALARLPYEQREVVALHLKESMTFRAIADLQKESINTIQSRYRYALKKLCLLLNGEVHP